MVVHALPSLTERRGSDVLPAGRACSASNERGPRCSANKHAPGIRLSCSQRASAAESHT